MGIFELLILAVGVSMDAFAVSICRGLHIKKLRPADMLEAGFYFGGFQALMPMLGYFMGAQFYRYIKAFDHWIVFVILGMIGMNMVKEALGSSADAQDEEDEQAERSMFALAIATSIDALAVGISLALLEINIFVAASFIGVTTFAFSAVGIKIGHVFGVKYKTKAEVVGGVILICIGAKILIEHLFLMG